MARMENLNKSQFLQAYGFPIEWEEWDLYPEDLFQGQRELMGDRKPGPDEHLRYGAFTWWVRKQRDLSKDTLIKLCRLAALDPDPGMGGAAIHDILFHPMANIEVATIAAELVQNQAGWEPWHPELTQLELFSQLLGEGQVLWTERDAAHRLARELQ
jgi:hypothetical protein